MRRSLLLATARWGSGQRCARCLSYDMGSTLLAAQVEQSAGSDARIDRVQSEIRSLGYMDGRDEEGSQCDFRSLRGKLWREIMSAPWPSWSKTVTHCWPSTTSRPSIGNTSGRQTRSKASLPHFETAPGKPGVPEPKDRACHGLQADDVSEETMAEDLRAKPSARDHSGG